MADPKNADALRREQAKLQEFNQELQKVNQWIQGLQKRKKELKRVQKKEERLKRRKENLESLRYHKQAFTCVSIQFVKLRGQVEKQTRELGKFEAAVCIFRALKQEEEGIFFSEHQVKAILRTAYAFPTSPAIPADFMETIKSHNLFTVLEGLVIDAPDGSRMIGRAVGVQRDSLCSCLFRGLTERAESPKRAVRDTSSRLRLLTANIGERWLAKCSCGMPLCSSAPQYPIPNRSLLLPTERPPLPVVEANCPPNRGRNVLKPIKAYVLHEGYFGFPGSPVGELSAPERFVASSESVLCPFGLDGECRASTCVYPHHEKLVLSTAGFAKRLENFVPLCGVDLQPVSEEIETIQRRPTSQAEKMKNSLSVISSTLPRSSTGEVSLDWVVDGATALFDEKRSLGGKIPNSNAARPQNIEILSKVFPGLLRLRKDDWFAAPVAVRVADFSPFLEVVFKQLARLHSSGIAEGLPDQKSRQLCFAAPTASGSVFAATAKSAPLAPSRPASCIKKRIKGAFPPPKLISKSDPGKASPPPTTAAAGSPPPPPSDKRSPEPTSLREGEVQFSTALGAATTEKEWLKLFVEFCHCHRTNPLPATLGEIQHIWRAGEEVGLDSLEPLFVPVAVAQCTCVHYPGMLKRKLMAYSLLKTAILKASNGIFLRIFRALLLTSLCVDAKRGLEVKLAAEEDLHAMLLQNAHSDLVVVTETIRAAGLATNHSFACIKLIATTLNSLLRVFDEISDSAAPVLLSVNQKLLEILIQYSRILEEPEETESEEDSYFSRREEEDTSYLSSRRRRSASRNAKPNPLRGVARSDAQELCLVTILLRTIVMSASGRGEKVVWMLQALAKGSVGDEPIRMLATLFDGTQKSFFSLLAALVATTGVDSIQALRPIVFGFFRSLGSVFSGGDLPGDIAADIAGAVRRCQPLLHAIPLVLHIACDRWKRLSATVQRSLELPEGEGRILETLQQLLALSLVSQELYMITGSICRMAMDDLGLCRHIAAALPAVFRPLQRCLNLACTWLDRNDIFAVIESQSHNAALLFVSLLHDNLLLASALIGVSQPVLNLDQLLLCAQTRLGEQTVLDWLILLRKETHIIVEIVDKGLAAVVSLFAHPKTVYTGLAGLASVVQTAVDHPRNFLLDRVEAERNENPPAADDIPFRICPLCSEHLLGMLTCANERLLWACSVMNLQPADGDEGKSACLDEAILEDRAWVFSSVLKVLLPRHPTRSSLVAQWAVLTLGTIVFQELCWCCLHPASAVGRFRAVFGWFQNRPFRKRQRVAYDAPPSHSNWERSTPTVDLCTLVLIASSNGGAKRGVELLERLVWAYWLIFRWSSGTFTRKDVVDCLAATLPKFVAHSGEKDDPGDTGRSPCSRCSKHCDTGRIGAVQEVLLLLCGAVSMKVGTMCSKLHPAVASLSPAVWVGLVLTLGERAVLDSPLSPVVGVEGIGAEAQHGVKVCGYWKSLYELFSIEPSRSPLLLGSTIVLDSLSSSSFGISNQESSSRGTGGVASDILDFEPLFQSACLCSLTRLVAMEAQRAVQVPLGQVMLDTPFLGGTSVSPAGLYRLLKDSARLLQRDPDSRTDATIVELTNQANLLAVEELISTAMHRYAHSRKCMALLVPWLASVELLLNNGEWAALGILRGFLPFFWREMAAEFVELTGLAADDIPLDPPEPLENRLMLMLSQQTPQHQAADTIKSSRG